MPNYKQGDAGYNPTVGLGQPGQTEAQSYEQQGRSRYADILQRLTTPLYDPMKDSATSEGQIQASGKQSLKSMGGKYKNMKFNPNDSRYASIIAALNKNASAQKQGEEDTRRGLTDEVGTAQQNENLAWDQGGMNSILNTYSRAIQADQAKQRNDAETMGAITGAAGSVVKALLGL